MVEAVETLQKRTWCLVPQQDLVLLLLYVATTQEPNTLTSPMPLDLIQPPLTRLPKELRRLLLVELAVFRQGVAHVFVDLRGLEGVVEDANVAGAAHEEELCLPAAGGPHGDAFGE